MSNSLARSRRPSATFTTTSFLSPNITIEPVHMLARVALCLPAAGWDSASGLTAVTGRPEACGAKLTAPPPRVAAVIESAAKLPAADGSRVAL